MKSVGIVAAMMVAASAVVDEPVITQNLPPHVADLLRLAVFTLAGMCLGLLTLIMYKFQRLNYSPDDRLLRPVAALCVSYFLSILFIALEVFNQYGHVQLTYRTPYALAAFIIGLPALFITKRRLSRALQMGKDTGAAVKLAVLDTSKPGPDIDMIQATEGGE